MDLLKEEKKDGLIERCPTDSVIGSIACDKR